MFTAFEFNGRIIVAAIAGDDCYFVSTRGESASEISEVLCCRNHIRIKALIEEQNPQGRICADLRLSAA